MPVTWKKISRFILLGLVLMYLSLGPSMTGKATVMMEACKDLAFSTSEDFVSHGPLPPDGTPLISDGDLLGSNCRICARNADLMAFFDVNPSHDLGLDAVDVIDVENTLVAFSTELDSSNLGQFKAGDLLITNGAIIPNQALTYTFGQGTIQVDLGLDAVHFIGAQDGILAFLDAAAQYPRQAWLDDPDLLTSLLYEFGIDLWFSTEGTPGPVGSPLFLDGDVLSAKTGIIVAANGTLLPATVPAGLPIYGVDFGLDALTGLRTFDLTSIHFSTEILFMGEPNFSDGDVLRYDNGVVYTNLELVGCFEPKAGMLGLDALYLGDLQANSIYLPITLKSE